MHTARNSKTVPAKGEIRTKINYLHIGVIRLCLICDLNRKMERGALKAQRSLQKFRMKNSFGLLDEDMRGYEFGQVYFG
jgi:hypothetical protein